MRGADELRREALDVAIMAVTAGIALARDEDQAPLRAVQALIDDEISEEERRDFSGALFLTYGLLLGRLYATASIVFGVDLGGLWQAVVADIRAQDVPGA